MRQRAEISFRNTSGRITIAICPNIRRYCTCWTTGVTSQVKSARRSGSGAARVMTAGDQSAIPCRHQGWAMGRVLRPREVPAPDPPVCPAARALATTSSREEAVGCGQVERSLVGPPDARCARHGACRNIFQPDRTPDASHRRRINWPSRSMPFRRRRSPSAGMSWS